MDAGAPLADAAVRPDRPLPVPARGVHRRATRTGRYDAAVSRLPSLGPRGEGWLAIQIALFWAIIATALLGPAWEGVARTISSVTGGVLLVAGLGLGARGV